MRSSIVERLRSLMAERALAAVIVGSPENFAYVSGFVVPSHSLMRWRHTFAVITAAGQCAVVCVDMEESTVRERLPDGDVRVWDEFGGDPMETLAGVLAELGATSECVGIEFDFLPAGDYARLSALTPATEFVPVERDLAALRMIKDSSEIALLRRLACISDRAIADAFAAVGVGATELDLASALTDRVFEQGADQFKLMIVATGERSQLPNVGPTSRVLRPWDVCRVEIFSVIDGYHAGVCRTAVVVEPPPGAAAIWAGLIECRRALVEALKPGAETAAVWGVFKDEFDRMGLPSISFAGHGIGVHLHEEPYVGPFQNQALQSGMVLGIEPLVYRTGLGFGLQVKDMVAIGPDGCEILSDVSATDELAVIQ